MLSKNVNNKKCAPKLVFFNEKKIEKDLTDFWTWKIDFESQILALSDTFPLIQFSKFNNFLWVCWFSGKNISNFVSPVWKLYNPYCHTGRRGLAQKLDRSRTTDRWQQTNGICRRLWSFTALKIETTISHRHITIKSSMFPWTWWSAVLCLLTDAAHWLKLLQTCPHNTLVFQKTNKTY